jgi:MoaA/NifB/PqqE/SkfB family radical SAM enzyme
LAGQSAWELVINSIALIREAGANVTPVFVATRKNIHHFPDVVEIAALFKIKKIIFNKYNLQIGCSDTNELFVDESLIHQCLARATCVAEKHNIYIELGTPIEDHDQLKGMPNLIKCGECSVASDKKQYVVDFLGNIRGCLMSTHLLGNIMHQSMNSVLNNKKIVYRSVDRLESVCPLVR